MVVWGLVSLALFHYTATGVWAFSVTTSTPDIERMPNTRVVLSCQYTADFGEARVEWKFNDLKGSQTYVYYQEKITEQFTPRVKFERNDLIFEPVLPKDTGVYDCEVSGNKKFGETRVKLTVLMPPDVPLCKVPSSVTTGKQALLTCQEKVGSPPPTYTWYKDGVALPTDPKTMGSFRNLTYNLNTGTGNLEFAKASKIDSGSYYCIAKNKAGTSQQCRATKMEVRDLNTGGIVAGVIIFLLLLALLGFGIWYAYKKGYIPKKTDKPKSNVVYQPPSVYGGGEDDDGDFKQKSSFVV